MEHANILARIKEIRRNKGWSQSEMAGRLNVALKTYQNLEGGITRIDIERLSQIASLLGVEPVALFGHAAKSNENTDRLTSEEKDLYQKIIKDKEAYINRLEENLKIYQDILTRNSDDSDVVLSPR